MTRYKGRQSTRVAPADVVTIASIRAHGVRMLLVYFSASDANSRRSIFANFSAGKVPILSDLLPFHDTTVTNFPDTL